MRKQFNIDTDLFIGTYCTCYVYADRTRETRGDYHNIGRVFYNPLRVEIMDPSPKYAEAHARMQEDFTRLSGMDRVQVSATGQTTKIGKA